MDVCGEVFCRLAGLNVARVDIQKSLDDLEDGRMAVEFQFFDRGRKLVPRAPVRYAAQFRIFGELFVKFPLVNPERIDRGCLELVGTNFTRWVEFFGKAEFGP